MKRRPVWLDAAAVVVFGACLTAQADWRAHVIYCAVAAPDYDLVNGYDSSGNLVYSTRVGAGEDATPPQSVIGNAIELNPSSGNLLVGFWEHAGVEGKSRDTWLLSGANGSVISKPGGYITAALEFGPDGNFYQAAKWDAAPTLRGIWQLDPVGVPGAGPFVADQLDYIDLAFGPDGHIYATVEGSPNVHKFNGTSGALMDASFITGGFAFRGLEWRGNVLYVAEASGGGAEPNGTILRYDTGGSPLGAFVAAGAGGLTSPYKFDFIPDGGMLVCDYHNGLGGASGDGLFVRQYDNTGLSMGDFTSVRPLGLWSTHAWPRDVAVAEVPPPPKTNFTCYAVWAHTANDVWDEIWAYAGNGGVLWTDWDQVAGDDVPTGIDLHPENDLLYVGYWDGLRYQSFQKDGTFVASSPGIGNLSSDLEIGPDGNVYLCITDGGGVDRWDPATDTKIDDFIDTNALAMAFGPDGHIYVRTSTATVQKYSGSTGALLDGSFIAAGLENASKMKWYNGNLYIAVMHSVSSTEDGAIKRFSSSGTDLGFFVGIGAGGLMNPQGFDFTPDGGVIVADYWGGDAGPMALRRYDGNGTPLGDFGSGPDGAWGPNGWPYDVVIEPIAPGGLVIMLD